MSNTNQQYELLWANAHTVAYGKTVSFLQQRGITGDLNSIETHTGPCGFAWVSVPGTDPFVKWLKKNSTRLLGHANAVHRDEQYGGVVVYWVSEFNQCMYFKELYAQYFAEFLRTQEVKAKWHSRMD